MKKLVLILITVLFITNANVQAQTLPEYEVAELESLYNKKISKQIGTYAVVEKGKTYADVANFLFSKGWEIISVCVELPSRVRGLTKNELESKVELPYGKWIKRWWKKKAVRRGITVFKIERSPTAQINGMFTYESLGVYQEEPKITGFGRTNVFPENTEIQLGIVVMVKPGTTNLYLKTVVTCFETGKKSTITFKDKNGVKKELFPLKGEHGSQIYGLSLGKNCPQGKYEVKTIITEGQGFISRAAKNFEVVAKN